MQIYMYKRDIIAASLSRQCNSKKTIQYSSIQITLLPIKHYHNVSSKNTHTHIHIHLMENEIKHGMEIYNTISLKVLHYTISLKVFN
jgi:hypothetical protein